MIYKLTEPMYQEALSAIEAIGQQSDSSLTAQIRQQVETAFSYLCRLKAKMLDYSFPDAQDEISFFKQIKPKFSALLIYYSAIERIELTKPGGSPVNLKNYYQRELKAVGRFFEANREIYAYYRSEKDHLDHLLFLRGQADPPRWLCKIHVDHDERFSTAADYIFANIRAKEQIARYLENALSGLDFHPFDEDEPTNWTGESIDLLEVAYGWFYTGQINHGKAEIGIIVRKLEKVFNVNIGRPARRLSEIRQRKRLSRTKYIDKMAKAIQNRLDDDDAFTPKKY